MIFPVQIIERVYQNVCGMCIIAHISLYYTFAVSTHKRSESAYILLRKCTKFSTVEISGPTSNKHLTDINQEVNPGLRKWHRESHSRLKSDKITEYSTTSRRVITSNDIHEPLFLVLWTPNY